MALRAVPARHRKPDGPVQPSGRRKQLGLPSSEKGFSDYVRSRELMDMAYRAMFTTRISKLRPNWTLAHSATKPR